MPESSTSEPYSLIARANESAAPEVIAGARLGRMIIRKTVNRLAPERGRGLLHLGLELDQHRLHRADDERQRDEQEREDDRGWVLAQSSPSGLAARRG